MFTKTGTNQKMKKKVALLLAFVMILSLIPMQAFGNRGTITPIHNTAGAAAGAQTYNVGINFQDLTMRSTSPNGLFIEFRLEGRTTGNAGNFLSFIPNPTPDAQGVLQGDPVVHFSGISQFTPGTNVTEGRIIDLLNDGNGLPVGTPGRITGAHDPQNRVSNTSVVVPLAALGAAFDEFIPNAAGILNAQVGISFQNPPNVSTNVRLVVNLFERRGTEFVHVLELANERFINPHPPAGVVIEGGAVVPLVTHAVLNPIRITERSVGNLSPSGFLNSNPNNFAIQLVAPLGFTWVTSLQTGLNAERARVVAQETVFQPRPEMTGTPAVSNRPSRFTNADLGIGAPALIDLSSSNGGERVNVAADFIHMGVDPSTQRDVLIVLVEPLQRLPGVMPGVTLGWIEIRNLMLIANPNAPTSGEAGIDVNFGNFEFPRITGGAFPGSALMSFADLTPANISQGRFSRAANNADDPVPFFIAGTGTAAISYAWNALAANRPGPQPVFLPNGQPSMVPGINADGTPMLDANGNPVMVQEYDSTPSNSWRALAGDNWRNTITVISLGGQATVTVEGPSTANVANVDSGTLTGWLNNTANNRFTVRITETVQNTLFRGIDQFEFRIVQPGVNFRNARWTRIADITGNIDDNRAFGTAGILEGFTDVLSRADWVTDPSRFRFTPSTADTSLNRRAIDFQFDLSIEAGFEVKHGGIIEMEVWRNNVLIDTVLVAEVTDLITIQEVVPEDIVRAQLDMIPLGTIPSVTVTETRTGALTQNTQLWVYLVATQDGRVVPVPGEMNLFLTSAPTITGNIQLRQRGNQPMPVGFGHNNITQTGITGTWTTPWPSFVRDAFIFDVLTPSTGAPSTITFHGAVSGWLVPGIEYQLVVGGNAVSQNSHHVLLPNPVNVARLMFHDLPYATTVLRVLGEAHVEGPGLGGIEPGPATPGPETPGPAATPEPPATPAPATPAPRPPQQTLVVGGGGTMQGLDGNGNPVVIADPLRSVVNPSNPNQMMSMVAVAAITGWLGGDSTWNEATATVTITANNVNGVPTTVTLQTGNNFANITGHGEVDIATFVSFTSGPANSVRPTNIGGRLFVPLRFLVDAFGFEIDASQFPTITIR